MIISAQSRRTVSQDFVRLLSDQNCEKTQPGDHESPVLFFDSIQDLIDSLESKVN